MVITTARNLSLILALLLLGGCASTGKNPWKSAAPDVPRHRGLRPLRPPPYEMTVGEDSFTAFTWERTDKAEALRQAAGL